MKIGKKSLRILLVAIPSIITGISTYVVAIEQARNDCDGTKSVSALKNESVDESVNETINGETNNYQADRIIEIDNGYYVEGNKIENGRFSGYVIDKIEQSGDVLVLKRQRVR